MCIVLIAAYAVPSVIGVHDQQHLIQVGHETVVVFIPPYDDCVAALLPSWRAVDRRDDGSERKVADVNQSGVQAGLRAIVNRIKRALRTAVTASVLIVALVRNNNRQVRKAAGSQIVPKPALAFEPHNIRQTVMAI